MCILLNTGLLSLNWFVKYWSRLNTKNWDEEFSHLGYNAM
jgi:hypothetical protein